MEDKRKFHQKYQMVPVPQQPPAQPELRYVVSLKPVKEGTEFTRKPLPVDKEFAARHKIGVIRLQTGVEVLAAITMRSTLIKPPDAAEDLRVWEVQIAPHDPAVLMRLAFHERAERGTNGQTVMGALDAPLPRIMEAHSDVAEQIRKNHEALNALNPPIGTWIQVTYARTMTLRAAIGLDCSSTQIWKAAIAHNRRAMELFEARHGLFKRPMLLPFHDRFEWLNWDLSMFWPRRPLSLPSLIPVPDLPNPDPWERGGEKYDKIAEIVTHERFEKPFLSLLKALIQDGRHDFLGPRAKQLIAQGYRLTQFAATQPGVGVLPDLMSKMPKTDFGTEEELGAEFVRSLTSHDA